MDRAKKVLIPGIFLLFGFAVMGNYLRHLEPSSRGLLGLSEIPLASGLEYRVEPLEEDFLQVLKAEEAVFRTYDPDGDRPIWLFLAYFEKQKEGSQVHSPMHCYPGSGWNILEQGGVAAGWGNDRIRRLVVGDGHSRRLVRYWFQTNEGVVDNVKDLKIHLTKNAILHRPGEVVFVRISTPLDDRASAGRRLDEFTQSVHAGVEWLYRRRNESG
jgi:EpsI family protein